MQHAHMHIPLDSIMMAGTITLQIKVFGKNTQRFTFKYLQSSLYNADHSVHVPLLYVYITNSLPSCYSNLTSQ